MQSLLPVLALVATLLATSVTQAEMALSESVNGSPEVYRLTVTPAAEPSPAFKHRLVTPPHKLQRGNAPAFYRRVHAENTLTNAEKSLKNQFGDRWYDWVASGPKLGDIPLNDLQQAVQTSDFVVYQYLRPGTLCRECDWGLAVEDLTGPDTIAFLLPEYQGMRQLARLTALHTRLAIAQRRYDDAIDYLRMNYRMGRDTAETPFFVCGLVGVAIVGITNNNALDLIAAPDSPNLYWALGELNAALPSLHTAIQLEASIGERFFPLLAEAETANYAPDEWNRRWLKMQSDAIQLAGATNNQSSNVFQSAMQSVGTLSLSAAAWPHAKQRLIDWGYQEKRVEGMPIGQVLALYSARVYQIHSQDLLKHYSLPFKEGQQRVNEANNKLSKVGPFSNHPNREILPIATNLLPAVMAARSAEMRIRREVAVLRAIEAIRMHAAATGELPRSLNEVTIVPVPKNPATGEPFQFEAEQASFVFGDEAARTGKVTLILPESDGIRDERRYEIRLAKADTTE